MEVSGEVMRVCGRGKIQVWSKFLKSKS